MALLQGRTPGTNSIEGWVGPGAGPHVWSKEKSWPQPEVERLLSCAARSLVTMLTELSWV